MESRFKVVVIGLDGATFDLIKPWAEDGKLPTIAKLLTEGAAGPLRSTVPPMTAPAWSSFMTGKNPGKHGLYDWIYRHPDSYDVSPVTASHCKEPAIWEILGDQGRRVCSVNIPMTFPPKPVNGSMLSGLPAPSAQAGISYPPALLPEIERELGEYLLYPDPGQAYSDAGVDDFLRRLSDTTAMRFKVIHHLFDREAWDFFMVVLNGTDTVQHAMWKYMDPSHPLHDPSKRDRYGRAIEDYYVSVDRYLGELVPRLDDNTVLMLMSDHGFGPFHKFIHVNNWLRKMGWLKLKNTPVTQFKRLIFDLGFAPMKVYDLLMRLGFGSLKREVVRGRGQGLMKTLFLSFDDVDWEKTEAYSLGNVGQIRLNVRGREPLGTVSPGEEYETLRAEIMDGLSKVVDPVTGENVVEYIYRREEIYAGQNLEAASDILFIPTRMEYFGFGEYEFGSNRIIESMKRGISGTHRMHGIFCMWGEPVAEGQWLQGLEIVDLAPTILHLSGLGVPAGMDGKVIVDGLKAPYRNYRVVEERPPEPVSSPPGAGGDLSAEDEEALVKRLRDLGYVG